MYSWACLDPPLFVLKYILHMALIHQNRQSKAWASTIILNLPKFPKVNLIQFYLKKKCFFSYTILSLIVWILD